MKVRRSREICHGFGGYPHSLLIDRMRQKGGVAHSCGSRLTSGFLTRVPEEAVWTAGSRLDVEARSLLVMSGCLYQLRVKVNLNGGGEEKGKPTL